MDFLVRVPKLWRVLLDHAPVERASIPHGFAEATDLETWPAKEACEERQRTADQDGGRMSVLLLAPQIPEGVVSAPSLPSQWSECVLGWRVSQLSVQRGPRLMPDCASGIAVHVCPMTAGRTVMVTLKDALATERSKRQLDEADARYQAADRSGRSGSPSRTLNGEPLPSWLFALDGRDPRLSHPCRRT